MTPVASTEEGKTTAIGLRQLQRRLQLFTIEPDIAPALQLHEGRRLRVQAQPEGIAQAHLQGDPRRRTLNISEDP